MGCVLEIWRASARALALRVLKPGSLLERGARGRDQSTASPNEFPFLGEALPRSGTGEVS